MKISKSIELPSGSVRFEGELDQTELDYVLTVGLSLLFAQGAMPYVLADEEDDASFAPNTTGTVQ